MHWYTFLLLSINAKFYYAILLYEYAEKLNSFWVSHMYGQLIHYGF